MPGAKPFIAYERGLVIFGEYSHVFRSGGSLMGFPKNKFLQNLQVICIFGLQSCSIYSFIISLLHNYHPYL
jgi:hypothetical protein